MLALIRQITFTINLNYVKKTALTLAVDHTQPPKQWTRGALSHGERDKE